MDGVSYAGGNRRRAWCSAAERVIVLGTYRVWYNHPMLTRRKFTIGATAVGITAVAGVPFIMALRKPKRVTGETEASMDDMMISLTRYIPDGDDAL